MSNKILVYQLERENTYLSPAFFIELKYLLINCSVFPKQPIFLIMGGRDCGK